MKIVKVNVEGHNAYLTSYKIHRFLKNRDIESYCEVRGAGGGSTELLEMVNNSKLTIAVATSISTIIGSHLTFLVQRNAGTIILQSGDKRIEVPRGTRIEDIERYAQTLKDLENYSITCQLEDTPKQKD